MINKDLEMKIFAVVCGGHRFLFVVLFLLNIIELSTRCYRSRILNEQESVGCVRRLMKKIWYWIVVFVSFLIAYAFKEIGRVIDVKVDMVEILGWLTIATYIVIEAKNILKNLKEMGVKVPEFLVLWLDKIENLMETKGRAKMCGVDEGD